MTDREKILLVTDSGEKGEITNYSLKMVILAGWIFYIASHILNFIYYIIHPSSPELFTWGAEEVLEKWPPLLGDNGTIINMEENENKKKK